eukprot:120255_1
MTDLNSVRQVTYSSMNLPTPTKYRCCWFIKCSKRAQFFFYTSINAIRFCFIGLVLAIHKYKKSAEFEDATKFITTKEYIVAGICGIYSFALVIFKRINHYFFLYDDNL